MIKRNVNAGLYIVAEVLAAVAYFVIHACAATVRGYRAIGGEAVLITIPLLVQVGAIVIGDAIGGSKRGKLSRIGHVDGAIALLGVIALAVVLLVNAARGG